MRSPGMKQSKKKKPPQEGKKTYIFRYQVSIGRGIEAFSDKVADVTEADEDEVANVGREKNIVGGVMLNVCRDLGASNMSRGESIPAVGAVAKLCVDSGKDLFRGWRPGGEGETVGVVVILVKGGFVGRGGERGGDGECGGGGGRADMGVVVTTSTGICLAECAEVGGGGGHGGGERLGLALPEEGGL